MKKEIELYQTSNFEEAVFLNIKFPLEQIDIVPSKQSIYYSFSNSSDLRYRVEKIKQHLFKPGPAEFILSLEEVTNKLKLKF